MPNDHDDGLEKELEQIVNEAGLAKAPRPVTSDPEVESVSGMDHEKYMVTSSSGASEWKVFVRGAKGSEVAADAVPPGEYLNAWSQLGEKETAWCVDSYLLPTDEDPVEVRIVIPGRSEPLVLPHPSRR